MANVTNGEQGQTNFWKEFEEINETYNTLKELINFYEEINKTENALKVQIMDRKCQREKNSIDFWIDFFGITLLLWISAWGLILIAMSCVKLRNTLWDQGPELINYHRP